METRHSRQWRRSNVTRQQIILTLERLIIENLRLITIRSSVGVGIEPHPHPSSCLQMLIFQWKSALNFNPLAKFQTFRQLTTSSFRPIPTRVVNNTFKKYWQYQYQYTLKNVLPIPIPTLFWYCWSNTKTCTSRNCTNPIPYPINTPQL